VKDHITIELIPPVKLTYIHFSSGDLNSKDNQSKIVGAKVELKLARDDIEIKDFSRTEDNFVVTL
jgi:hypothetical protein